MIQLDSNTGCVEKLTFTLNYSQPYSTAEPMAEFIFALRSMQSHSS